MKIDCAPIGALLIRKGCCSAQAVLKAVERKEAGDHRPLGEVLCAETGLSRDALEVAYIEEAFFPAVAELIFDKLVASRVLRSRRIYLSQGAGPDFLRIIPVAWQVKTVTERQYRRSPGETLARTVSYLSAISGTAVPVLQTEGGVVKGNVFPFVFNIRTRDLDINLHEIASDFKFKLVQKKLGGLSEPEGGPAAP